MRPDEQDDGLRLDEHRQVLAVRDAVYRAARVNGVGPRRAAAVAEAATVHLVGQLRQRGFRVRVEWASAAARETMEAAHRVYDPPPEPLPEP